MRTLCTIAYIFFIGFGLLAFATSGYYSLVDWAILQKNEAAFEKLATHSTSMPALFAAESMQNIHRINLFAEGVWCLLGGILAVVGLSGLQRQTGQKS